MQKAGFSHDVAHTEYPQHEPLCDKTSNLAFGEEKTQINLGAAQSGQSLHSQHEESSGPYFSYPFSVQPRL